MNEKIEFEITIVFIDDISQIDKLLQENKGHFERSDIGNWIVDSNGSKIKINKNHVMVPDRIVSYFRALGELFND